MLELSAKIRKIMRKKVELLRETGVIPAVLYGPKTKNLSLEVDAKEFSKVYQEAGENSIIELQITGAGKDQDQGKNMILVKQVTRHPISGDVTHIDFLQPDLTKKIEANVPLAFEGKALAVEELDGTLVKNLLEIEIKATPQNLPKEIKVDISGLKTFDDEILIKDLNLPADAEITRDASESVARVVPPTKVEEELEKPIEEKVEDVEKAGEDKEEKEDKIEEAKPETKPEKEEKTAA